MQFLSALIVALLFAGGTYLIFQRGFVRILFGFSLITHAANVFILAMSGEPGTKASPIITEGVTQYVDPLPQALILTAIVIGFGVTAYLVVLLYRLYRDTETTDAMEMYEDS
ncbi:NADH-quinone oxidoreductase subunit K [bacterium]|nr:NADH-quinone oxidoreductase subunit K [bacterium]